MSNIHHKETQMNIYRLNQKDVKTIFNQGSPALIACILQAEGENVWAMRANQLVSMVAKALCELRDKQALNLTAKAFQENLSAKEVYALSQNNLIRKSTRDQLKRFLESVPRGSGTIEESITAIACDVFGEQYGYVTMLLTSSLDCLMEIEEG